MHANLKIVASESVDKNSIAQIDRFGSRASVSREQHALVKLCNVSKRVFSYWKSPRRGKRSSVCFCKGMHGELRMLTSC